MILADVSQLPERHKRELVRGFHAQAELAVHEQRIIKEELDQIEHRHIEGVGQKIMTIGSRLAAHLRVQYGVDCLHDKDFLRSLRLKNPFLRIKHNGSGKTTVRVDGLKKEEGRRKKEEVPVTRAMRGMMGFLILTSYFLLGDSAFAKSPATYVPRSIKEMDDARGVTLTTGFVPIFDGTKFTPRALLFSDVTVADAAAARLALGVAINATNGVAAATDPLLLHTNLAVAALAINTTTSETRFQTKTISTDSTFTFSGSIASGKTVPLTLENSSTSPHVITIPSSYSVARGGFITSLVIPPKVGSDNGLLELSWRNDGTRNILMGDPPLGNLVTVPATAAAAGNAGDWSYDSGFYYICIAANTWKRVAVATW